MKFSTILLAPLAAWLLKKVERDYELRGQLSTEASAAGWILYVTHLLATLTAALRPGRQIQMHERQSTVLGGVLALSGCWFYFAAMREFRSFEQVSGTETGNLVKSGPYRYSRNPQILGWGLALLSASIAGRSPKALLLTAAFFLIHRLYFISEKQHLERSFGE